MIEIIALIMLSISGVFALIWGVLALACYIQERRLK